jgi:hypothetical protein
MKKIVKSGIRSERFGKKLKPMIQSLKNLKKKIEIFNVEHDLWLVF